MAIKGKTKHRGGRPPARAPRREPVAVAPPLFRRRWVQVLAGVLAGAVAVLLVIWVTNGLRQERDDDADARAATTRREAAQEWQRTLEGEIGKLGPIAAGQPPVVLGELSGAIDDLADGKAPEGTDEKIADQLTLTKAAAETLDEHDLTAAIADQGFDVEQTNYLLNSRTRVVHALRLYEQAALLARLALEADGEERVALATRAAAVRDIAQGILDEGWNDYQQVMFAVGLAQVAQPTGIIPGVVTGPLGTGASGPTGVATGPTGAT